MIVSSSVARNPSRGARHPLPIPHDALDHPRRWVSSLSARSTWRLRCLEGRCALRQIRIGSGIEQGPLRDQKMDVVHSAREHRPEIGRDARVDERFDLARRCRVPAPVRHVLREDLGAG